MTSGTPPSQPPPTLHTHPEVPVGVTPAPREPEPPPPGSLGVVPWWAPLAAMVAAFVVATLAYLLIAAGVEAATSPRAARQAW